jgi:hypothetical protein
MGTLRKNRNGSRNFIVAERANCSLRVRHRDNLPSSAIIPGEYGRLCRGEFLSAACVPAEDENTRSKQIKKRISPYVDFIKIRGCIKYLFEAIKIRKQVWDNPE